MNEGEQGTEAARRAMFKDVRYQIEDRMKALQADFALMERIKAKASMLTWLEDIIARQPECSPQVATILTYWDQL